MVKTLTAATVADDEQYVVKLLRPLKIGRTWLRPGDAETRLRGDVIKGNADAVGAISKVAK